MIWEAVLDILPFGVRAETASCPLNMNSASSITLIWAGFIAEQIKIPSIPLSLVLIMWINERYICSSWLTSLKQSVALLPFLVPS